MLLPESLLSYLKINGAKIEMVHEGVNRTFLVEKSNPYEKFIIKQAIVNKSVPATALGEMFWLSYMVDERFPCVIPYIDHDWHQNVITMEGEVFSLYKFIAGIEPNSAIIPNYYLAGKVLRDLHDRNFKHVNILARQRLTYNAQFVIQQFIPVIQENPVFPEDLKKSLVSSAKEIAVNFPQDQQFIHGDFHLGNLVMTESGIKVLDFDECGFGSKFYDLGTMRLHTISAGNEEAWEAFLNGYGIWDREGDDLKYGCAARIFYMMATIPERMKIIPDLAIKAPDIIKRYAVYLNKVLGIVKD